jgi:hypothetical protein
MPHNKSNRWLWDRVAIFWNGLSFAEDIAIERQNADPKLMEAWSQALLTP